MKTMAKRPVVLAICLALSTLCGVGSAKAVTSAKQEKKKLAATLLINEIAKGMRNKAIDLMALSKEMKANKKKYQDRNYSQTALRNNAKADLEKKFQQECQVIFDELDEDKPEGSKSWFDKTWRDKIGKSKSAEVKENIEKNLQRNYQGAFKKARDPLVAKQAGRMLVNAYPSPEQVETIEDKSKTSKTYQDLYAKLVRQATEDYEKKHNEPVFSENKKVLIAPKIDKILEDATKQLKKQKSIVEDFGAEDSKKITLAGITKELHDKISSYQAGLKIDGKTIFKVYERFPSVENKLNSQAKEIGKEKFVDQWLPKKKYTFTDGQAWFKRIIEKDIKKHHRKSRSKEILIELLRETIEKRVFSDYAGQLPETEKQSFQVELKNLVSGDAKYGKNLKEVISQSLETDFNKARKEIKNEQLTEWFPRLKDGTWPEKEEEYAEVEKYDKASYWSKNENLLQKKGASSKSLEGKDEESLFLEETIDEASETAKKLLQEGVSALKGQGGIVDTVEKKLKSELRERELLPSDEELTKEFTDDVESQWQKDRLSSVWGQRTQPPNAATKYKPLFSSVKKDIETKAKAMLPREKERREEEIAKEKREEERKSREAEQKRLAEEAKAKAEAEAKARAKAEAEAAAEAKIAEEGKGQGKGPGPPGKGHPGVLKGGFTPDALIELDLNQSGDGLEVTIRFRNKPGGLSKFEFGKIEMLAFSDSRQLSRIQNLLEEWLRDSKKGTEKVSLYVLTLVYDDIVFYGIVFHLRECLAKAIKNVEPDGTKLEVSWYDCLFEKGKIPATPEMPTIPLEPPARERRILI